MDVDLTRFELLRNVIDALKANAPVASVVIAMLAFLVSLATYRRAWRWRSEAEPAFVQVQGDMLLVPEFKRAGVDPVFIGWLANCGDGRAFNVKAIGINCDAEVWDCRQIGETLLGIEPWKCGPLERLRRWHRDRKGHRRFHELDRKRALEQRKILS